MNFISLDKFPKGNLRTSVEEKILKHYKFYNSCMDGLSNLKEHSAHLFPLDSEEWSEKSIDEAKFNDPSQLAPTFMTQESILSIDYSDLDNIENTSFSNIIDLDGSNKESFMDTSSKIHSPNKREEGSHHHDGLIQIVDWLCNKENIPPMEEVEISSGQDRKDSPHRIQKKRVLQDVENTPKKIRKIQRRLFF